MSNLQELSQLFSEINRESTPAVSQQHLIDWDETREDLATLRAAMSQMDAPDITACIDRLTANIDRLDPTPGELAAAVTDLDAYRR